MEDYYSNRNSGARYSLVKINDDSGGEQYVDIQGWENDFPTKVMRVQQHGFASVPIKDSHHFGIHQGNSRDRIYLIGGEHPDKRPRKLGDGNSALYNADGSIWKMVGKSPSYKAEEDTTLESRSFVFKCGDVTMTLDKDGLTIKGGKVKHNDKNIGSDHTHNGVTPGSGTTGAPS